MAQLFVMPQQGSTMEEGTVVRWLKQENEPVREGEILLEIETDKSTMEIESPMTGVVRRLLVPAGEIVPVRTPIAILGSPDEAIDDLLGAPATPSIAPTPAAPAVSPPVAPRLNAASPAQEVFASPRARKIADEQGISIAALAGKGSGPEGRILERDVLAYLAEQKAQPAAPETSVRATPLAARIADDLGVNLNELATGLPGSRVRREDVLRAAETLRAPAEAAPTAIPAPAQVDYMSKPYAGMRKRIADNVAKSAFTAPHVTLTIEVDMTAAADFRAQLLPEVEKAYGVRLSYTDIIVKAVARALGEHPMLNSALVGDEIRIYTARNIGVAVALEEGLVVPVVKNAESKSLGAIAAEMKPLVERTRSGKFSPDDVAGGTFTITNLGAFGIDVFDPILVPPQAAILGVCRIVDRPTVINKEVVVRSMMNLCLSFDHRIVDGAPAARFLQRLKELLEAPMQILI
jgi:pyruvate dehydrogenase E2 component (dihydrolipoamide acetyltransferase)